jgi:replicative DNA helicase
MDSEILDRMPPSDVAVERQLIGCCLIEPKITEDVDRMVREADFYSDANRTLYGEMVRMAREGIEFDAGLLLDRLRSKGNLERIGGVAVFAELLAEVFLAGNWRRYADVILRHSRKRQIIEAAVGALRDAYDPGTEPDEVLTRLERGCSEVETGTEDSDPVTMEDAAIKAVMSIDRSMRSKRPPGIHTGFWQFDSEAGGLFPGELFILAARPSVGKTSLALQWAAQIAKSERTYFATLEMGAEELATKRICSIAGVAQARVRAGRIKAEDVPILNNAARVAATRNLILHDWSKIKVLDIERTARRVKAKCVFVDYLQIITPVETKGKNRYEVVGRIASDLKAMARSMQVPVIALCQIGRSAEQNKGGEPQVKDLRESGDIEAAADVIALLHRHVDNSLMGPTEDRYAARLKIAKNRLGKTGSFALDWEGSRTEFSCHDGQPVDEQADMF